MFEIRKTVAAAALALLLPAATAGAEDAVFDCVIDPSSVLQLGSPVTGILDSVSVSRGDRVTKGQAVAQLESGVEAATVELDRLRARSTAEIEAQEARLTYIRARSDRASKLSRSQIVSKDRMEQLLADQSVAERELTLKKLEKKQAELELKRSVAFLERRTIRSPIDGLVSERHLSPGEFVNQESRIVTLAKLDPLYVETFVRVSYWGRIRVGMTARVELDEPIGGSYEAEVRVVDRVFDAASGTFGVRLELPNPQNALPAGQRCRVRFAFAATDGAAPR